MAPKRTTRSTQVPPVTPAPTTTTTTITEAQLQALINQEVAAAMAEAEASRVRNGNDSNGLGPRLAQAVRECTYPDFLKCQPLNFKGTEGVVGLTQWSRSYMVKLPCEDCYSGSCSGIDMENFKENDDRQDDNNNQAQQQPLKKQGVAIAYTTGPGERKEYAGTLPLCNKCKFHHNGQCTVKCVNCKRVGHLTRDCRSPSATNNHRNLTCYQCGNQGHYRSDCPELKNEDHVNQARGTGARGMIHALEGGETN
nr:hypothetical protein [Tanacetum cinerariifolium]